ncbi:hypothetical protein N7534_005537 [Penicillium rubens]|nr:hypothetical protein N7534_005537 [Penicillium rubens]
MAQALSEVLMRLRLKTALDSDLQDSTPSAPTSLPLSGGRPSISFSPLTGSHIGTRFRRGSQGACLSPDHPPPAHRHGTRIRGGLRIISRYSHLAYIHNIEVAKRTCYFCSRVSHRALFTLGSTFSGCAVGTNDHPPAWHSIEASDHLDANWSLWLEAGNKYQDLGNPYTFCTRKSESILESFTVTTKDIEFFDQLESLSECTSQASAIFPVFPQQPQDVRVLWGFALFPENEGDHVKKNMLFCSGAYRDGFEVLQHSITIPRAMPRMSSTLLTRFLEDRAYITPKSISNLGLVGPFVETPWRTCVDVSYGVHAARIAVSRLMDLEARPEESSGPSIARLLISLLWK